VPPQALDPFGQRIDRLAQFDRDVLALAGQLEEGPRVVDQAVQLATGLDLLDQAGALALDFPGNVRVAPDLGQGQTRLDLLELALLAGDIKDTSAAPRRAHRGRRIARWTPVGWRWPRSNS